MTKRFRLQSAMEYLMTYGWAILVIAIVMVSLFSLGLFSGGFTPTACIAFSGYQCSTPVLTHILTGGASTTVAQLTFTFGQNTGSTIYNVIISAAPQSSALNTAGFPSTTAVWNGLLPSTATNPSAITSMVTGATNAVVINMPTAQVATNALGTAYSGYIWINYSTTSATTAATTAVKVATVSIKVT
ncbi:MAG: hypothetical protein KGI00_00070 [Candidatus Micrarchaeota archaeon]|nr:hypothetical protein [Candidatus Micrarchaeota archaeon]MDE1849112.1 hypothetical protein [Candidatus Micrarchaeota archaeon]